GRVRPAVGRACRFGGARGVGKGEGDRDRCEKVSRFHAFFRQRRMVHATADSYHLRMDSSVTRIFAPFYSSAFSWNFPLGMTQLLIPLYARELGYTGVEIGSLIAFPIVVQMIFNLIGGAWTDRLGGMNISLVAFAATAAAGIMFATSSSFAGLFAAQIMMIVARAVYWPASWTLVSQLPGERSSLMGT